MRKFTIYNTATKDVYEGVFNDLEQAEQFRKKNFSSNYLVGCDPFKEEIEFRKMLKPGDHIQFLTGKSGVCGIKIDGVIIHCGFITINMHMLLKLNNVSVREVTQGEFINMHNELIDAMCN